jgi:DNA end-binding protein Ku
LTLTLLRFADELVDTNTFTLPSGKQIRKQELDMAVTLVNSLAADWKPEKYTDEYRDNLMRIIQAKSKGKTITLEAAEEPRHAEVVDLMERQRQSLANRGAASKSAAHSTASSAKRRSTKKSHASKSRKRSAA